MSAIRIWSCRCVCVFVCLELFHRDAREEEKAKKKKKCLHLHGQRCFFPSSLFFFYAECNRAETLSIHYICIYIYIYIYTF